MGTLIALILNFLKWPVAIVVAAMTPAGAVAFWQLLDEAWYREIWASPLGVGFAITAALWIVFGRLRIVRFWCTMEHELTHAIFAWLTFVPVIELRTTDGTLETEDDSEGHVYLGGSNWLISISPYFFPTAAVAVLAATWALAAQPTQLAHGLLGAATAYSLASTWQEIHRHQDDLKSTGFGFSWLFLPGANLFCYGILLAYGLGVTERSIRYAIESFNATLEWGILAFSN